MIRKVTASILFLIMILFSVHIKSQIDAYNMDYYQGKDNGFFAQLNSIMLFSFVFFVMLSKKLKILYGFLGLIIGLISSIACYLIFGTKILFPISASLLIIVLFYLIEYLSKRKKEKKPAANSGFKKWRKMC